MTPTRPPPLGDYSALHVVWNPRGGRANLNRFAAAAAVAAVAPPPMPPMPPAPSPPPAYASLQPHAPGNVELQGVRRQPRPDVPDACCAMSTASARVTRMTQRFSTWRSTSTRLPSPATSYWSVAWRGSRSSATAEPRTSTPEHPSLRIVLPSPKPHTRGRTCRRSRPGTCSTTKDVILERIHHQELSATPSR